MGHPPPSVFHNRWSVCSLRMIKTSHHHFLRLLWSLFEAPQIDSYRHGDLRDIRRFRGRRRIRLSLDHIGSLTDRLGAIHQREHNPIARPLHAGCRQILARDIEVVFPRRLALRPAMSGCGIHREIGIAPITRVVPLRELDIDLVLRVGSIFYALGRTGTGPAPWSDPCGRHRLRQSTDRFQIPSPRR